MPAFGLASQLASALVSLLVSLCGRWSHVVFPKKVYAVTSVLLSQVFDQKLLKTSQNTS